LIKKTVYLKKCIQFNYTKSDIVITIDASKGEEDIYQLCKNQKNEIANLFFITNIFKWNY